MTPKNEWAGGQKIIVITGDKMGDSGIIQMIFAAQHYIMIVRFDTGNKLIIDTDKILPYSRLAEAIWKKT